MFSTRYMFSPWMYYNINTDNYAEILDDSSYLNVSTFNPVTWCGKMNTYYDRGNQSWKLAAAMAQRVSLDYGIDAYYFRQNALAGTYTGPLMVLRDC